jgi:hypothetical protein
VSSLRARLDGTASQTSQRKQFRTKLTARARCHFWGDRYAPVPNKALIPRPSENVLSRFLDPESVMRMRILAVIDYLNPNPRKIGLP